MLSNRSMRPLVGSALFLRRLGLYSATRPRYLATDRGDVGNAATVGIMSSHPRSPHHATEALQNDNNAHEFSPYRMSSEYQPDSSRWPQGVPEVNASYDTGSRVSLHAVMQSNVPEPFVARGKAPTHLNMPGGGNMMANKFTSAAMIANNCREYHSTAAARGQQFAASIQGAQEEVFSGVRDIEGGETPGVQGVQGDADDCNYQLWLSRCNKYGFEDCSQQLEGIQTGRLTLQEVLEEQEKTIRGVTARYEATMASTEAVDVQGVQGPIGERIQTLLRETNPCPQGIQGEDCADFKLWLENCARFGFADCEENLRGLQGGRKTLGDIIAEQDRLIRSVVDQFQKKDGGKRD